MHPGADQKKFQPFSTVFNHFLLFPVKKMCSKKTKNVYQLYGVTPKSWLHLKAGHTQ
jgi:hypothetical protein